MHRTFFAPLLSATVRFVSSCIIFLSVLPSKWPSANDYFALSTISTKRQHFRLLSGLVSIILTMSPNFAWRFSSCRHQACRLLKIFFIKRMRNPAFDRNNYTFLHFRRRRRRFGLSAACAPLRQAIPEQPSQTSLRMHVLRQWEFPPVACCATCAAGSVCPVTMSIVVSSIVISITSFRHAIHIGLSNVSA